MKGQDKTPEKQLNEVEIGNLPETKFKIMLVKMIQNIEKTREDPKNVYQNLEKLKNKQQK